MHVLDNPVWHALTGPQRTVAEGSSLARRYDPAIAPFAALPDEPSPASWDALADLAGPGGIALLLRGQVDPPGAPDGWRELAHFSAVQMVATSVAPTPAEGARELGSSDADAMVALVAATEPGPFTKRTMELGTYIGIHVDGALVAMAGERMRLPGYTEISAVCTDPAHRGRGLASALVRDLVGRIEARGDTPMLHVVDVNVAAQRVYESLGFTTRVTGAGVILRAPA